MTNKNPYKNKSLNSINQTIKQINRLSLDRLSFQPAIKKLESITMPLNQGYANEVLQQLQEATAPLKNYQTNLFLMSPSLKEQIDLIKMTAMRSHMNYFNNSSINPYLDLIRCSVQPFKKISEAYSLQTNALRNVNVLLDNILSTKDILKLSIQTIIGNLESIPSYVIDDSEELSEKIVNSMTELEESLPIEIFSSSNVIPVQREEPSLLQRVKSKLIKNGLALVTGLGLILQVYPILHDPVETKAMLSFLESINQNIVEVKQDNKAYRKQSLENQKRLLEIEEKRLAIEKSKQD